MTGSFPAPWSWCAHTSYAAETGDRVTLPESIQAYVGRKKPLQPPDWWSGPEGKLMEPLVPIYSGSAEPAVWNRVPGKHLVRGD